MATDMRKPEPSSTYSFTIHNKSGGRQSYVLFAGIPEVKPAQDHITSHAIVTARGIVSGSGSAVFVIRNDPYAICGTIYLNQSVRVQVLDKRQVHLGGKVSGFDHPGTNCLMDVDEGTPFFAPWSGSADDAGEPGAFCVKTVEFAGEEARNNGYILGLGTADSTSAGAGLHASFIPKPNTVYQIKPSQVFYIVAAQAQINEPKPVMGDAGAEAAIDFSLHPPQVQLIHGDDNKLRICDSADLALPIL